MGGSKMSNWWEEFDPYVYRATITGIVDGDTLQMKVDLGFNIDFEPRFRILELDTFEKYGVKKGSEEYVKGVAASEYAATLVSIGDPVKIRTHRDKTGKYGRYLVEIRLQDGSDYAAEMIKAGHDKNHQ
jgi:micrococcal nuclease